MAAALRPEYVLDHDHRWHASGPRVAGMIVGVHGGAASMKNPSGRTSWGDKALRCQFSPDMDSFDLHNALLLAGASEIVYREPAAAEQFVLRQWGFGQFAFIDADDTQAFVAGDPRTVVVCFRGTETNDLGDWLTDADTSLVAGPLGGRVHEGFYDALSHVWQAVDRAVGRFDPHKAKPLWITGHSMGGALAALAAARWLDRGRRVSGIYTFGQPRTGDGTFARNFNFELKCNAFRFVNNNDLVTRIPPRALGYSHLGTFKYLTSEGKLEDDIGWWRMFLDRWTFRLDEVLRAACDGIDDHSMITYRQCLEAAVAALPRRKPRAPQVRPPTIAPRPADNSSLIQPRRRAA